MASIHPFIQNSADFDDETTRRLGEAFDAACQSMGDRGLPDIVREIIARRIIAAAKQGERDPKQLCNTALAALGIDDQLGRFSGDVA